MPMKSLLADAALEDFGPIGLLGMTSPATIVQPVVPTVQPVTTVQPVVPTATPVAQPATPAPIWTGSLADLLNPNSLGMGQQLSPEAWAAIDKATGTNIGPAQDGSPYYSFTGLTDENSTGWTPTQAYYDALNGYTASNLGNDANSNYWNITGPNGTTSTAPTFASSAQDSLGGLDKLVLAGIGAAAGPALFAGLGGGATAGLGANLLAGAGSGAVLGGTMGAVTSTGDMNAIGQGILNGGLTGALGGAVYQGLNGGTATIPADSVPDLSGGTGLQPLDVNSYAIQDIGSVPSVSSPVLSASSIPSLGSYGLGALEGMGSAVVPSIGSVPSLYSPASLSALSVPDLSQGTGLQPLQTAVVDPVNSSGITNSFGLPNYAVDPINSYLNQQAINVDMGLPNYAVDPVSSYANQAAIDTATNLPNYAIDPANSFLNQQAATVPAVPELSGGTGLQPLNTDSYAIPDVGSVPSLSSPELSSLSVPDLSGGTGLQPLQTGVVDPVNVPSVGLPEAFVPSAPIPQINNPAEIPRVPAPQADYSNEGSHYTDQSTLNPATDSPVNAAPAASPGLLDWLKANPELAKLGLTAAGGLLGGLGSMGGGSIAKKPVTPNLWTVGKASNNYTPPTQYAAPQLNLTGQQNSGAWRWMKG